MAAVAMTTVIAVGAGVSADPSGAKNSFTFPASCSNGGEATDFVAIVNSGNGQGQGTENNPRGQANFSPAHMAGSNLIFHPTQFELTFTFTPGDGSGPFTFDQTATMKNAKTESSCTIDYTTPPDQDGNTFGLQGTVLGFFT